MPRPHDLGIPGIDHSITSQYTLEDYCHYDRLYYPSSSPPSHVALLHNTYYSIVPLYLMLRLYSLLAKLGESSLKSSSFFPASLLLFPLQSPPNASSMLPQCGQLPFPSTLLLSPLTGPNSIRSPGHQISPIRCSLSLARPLDWSNTRCLLGLPPSSTKTIWCLAREHAVALSPTTSGGLPGTFSLEATAIIISLLHTDLDIPPVPTPCERPAARCGN